MLDETQHILLLEDEAAHAELVARAFEMRGDKARLTVVTTLAEARVCLAQEPAPALIIADWRLPDGEGLDLLGGPEHLSAPVIIMTSHGNERVAVEALKAGALDYVVKSDTALIDMPHIAERAIREWKILAERERMQEALRASEDRFRSLVQNAYDVILVLDEKGFIRYESPSAARVLGFEPGYLASLPRFASGMLRDGGSLWNRWGPTCSISRPSTALS
jgi:DNA-binding NtrC family response regulator